jgi:hypothetical protein
LGIRHLKVSPDVPPLVKLYARYGRIPAYHQFLVSYTPWIKIAYWVYAVYPCITFNKPLKKGIIYRYTPIAPIDNPVNTFCDYLIDTSIDENATFPPYLWSSYNISGERTTNACEAFHSAFGKYFYSPRPNIFVFYKVLKIM